jgi:hypothetical protein
LSERREKGKYRENEEGQTALSTFAGWKENRRESVKAKIGLFVSFKIIKDSTPAPTEKDKRFTRWANCGEKLLKSMKSPFVRGLQFEANRVFREMTLWEGFRASNRDIRERVLKFAMSSQTKENERHFK